MSLSLIIIVVLLLLFFVISINDFKYNFVLLFILFVSFIRLSSFENIEIDFFSLNKINSLSIILILIFSMIFFNKLRFNIHNVYLSILALLSLNSNLMFFLIFELFYYSFFILNKNNKLSIKFLNLNYLLSTIISLTLYMYLIFNTNYYFGISCALYIIRYFLSSNYIIKNIITNNNIFFLCVYKIILSSYFFINNLELIFIRIFIVFLISIFILYNSIIYINKTYFDNTLVVSNYSLLLSPLSLFLINFNTLLTSYIIVFILLYLYINKFSLNFINFLLLPIPASPIFYFEITLIKELSSSMYTPLLALLFIFFMFFKIKNIDFFASKLQNIFKRV